MKDEDLLFLVKGGHMDMPTRIQKNIWPHEAIHMNDCIRVISNYLDEKKHFPEPWLEQKDGELISDYAAIEKTRDNKFVFYHREASQYDLTKISINEKKFFNNSENVIKHYLQYVLRLPGDLDGWKIVES